MSGPLYFLLVASMTTLSLNPFLLDRLIGARVDERALTLIFPMAFLPMAFVALEFMRSRLPQGPLCAGGCVLLPILAPKRGRDGADAIGTTVLSGA